MKLTDEQEACVRSLAEEGASLGEIQKRLEDQFGLNMTYMEARFLVSDLDVSLKSPVKEEPKADDVDGEDGEGEETDTATEVAADDSLLEDEGAPTAGGVSVAVDTIAQPETMVSGKATFSDGESAVWYIDMLGRLGLDTTTPGYQPSPADLESFQVELEQAVRRAGL